MTQLIGLTGYAQHGKDTVGRYLTGVYGYTRFAFADQLKELALIVNPKFEFLTGEKAAAGYTFRDTEPLSFIVQKVGWEGAKRVSEVRRFLQELGTGVRDIIGPDAWVNAVDRKIREALDYGDFDVVITDVRFPNEAHYIHSHGGLLWRVMRTTPEGTLFDNGIGTEHASEKYVADLPTDLLVVNTSGKPENAEHAVDTIMSVPRYDIVPEQAGMS